MLRIHPAVPGAIHLFEVGRVRQNNGGVEHFAFTAALGVQHLFNLGQSIQRLFISASAQVSRHAGVVERVVMDNGIGHARVGINALDGHFVLFLQVFIGLKRQSLPYSRPGVTSLLALARVD